MPTQVKVSPLRPSMMFTDKNGSLTKEAYDFLFAIFNRVGGSLSSLDAVTVLGYSWTSPGAIGHDTPNTGKFTSLSATTGNIPNFSSAVGTITALTATTGTINTLTAPNGTVTTLHSTTGTIETLNTTEGIIDTLSSDSGTITDLHSTTADIDELTATTGHFDTVSTKLGFGCNGKTPQVSYTVGNAVATTDATNTTPFGFTTAAQANDIVTKLNAVITALKNNGIIV